MHERGSRPTLLGRMQYGKFSLIRNKNPKVSRQRHLAAVCDEAGVGGGDDWEIYSRQLGGEVFDS